MYPELMYAMVLHEARRPLALTEIQVPEPNADQVLLKVECCAVCRTDLHVVDGELRDPKLPLIPGHQIVGTVVGVGSGGWGVGEEARGAEKAGAQEKVGAGEDALDQSPTPHTPPATPPRVGVPWLGWTCGVCSFCRSGRENLCDRARFTGYTLDGGYAQYAVADRRFCFPIPETYSSPEAAPLLCAGLIGFRAWRMIGEARRVGFYGFGSAAQILVQIARADGREVFAFTRGGDTAAKQFALDMGAVWAGDSGSRPPEPLDAAIIFAPEGSLVVTALRDIVKGGVVVCAGIHMSDIPSFPYELLWNERSIRSVANLTRNDGEEFFRRIAGLRIQTKQTLYPLERANEALADLRSGRLTGTAVLDLR
jgi:propanol-preferring alcohol dehydrogenase